jgi:response regulator RpfG family c-di-GMP phosphodiesterase
MLKLIKNTTPPQENSRKWNVLVVDDEKDMYDVTRIALANFEFQGRGVNIMPAFSAEEARKILYARDDFAVILLDVVMETEDAGLRLAAEIREQIGNKTSRIVLRTGQPGQAPELEVVRKYDINDYRSKPELSSERLAALMHTALRGYDDIMVRERSRLGLRKILDATPGIFKLSSYRRFATSCLDFIETIIGTAGDAKNRQRAAFRLGDDPNYLEIIAASGGLESLLVEGSEDRVPKKISERVDQAIAKKASVNGPDWIVVYAESAGPATLLYVDCVRAPDPVDFDLIGVFARHAGLGIRNLELMDAINLGKNDVVHILAEAIELRSEASGNHIRRVAKYASLLGRKAGFSEAVCETLEAAMPLHDIGKVLIPEEILRKRGPLEEDEWKIMKAHALAGENMLGRNSGEVFEVATIIAGQHHERWDGKGYPRGLSGEKIHVFGRIAAIVDVFDVFSSHRWYRQDASLDEVWAYVIEESGKHFDPKLVELMLKAKPEIEAIRAELPDPPADPNMELGPLSHLQIK